MNFYSQKDSRWSGYKYYGNYSLGSYGCFVTSLAMMVGQEPPTVADQLRSNGCFQSGGLLVSSCAAKTLKIDYSGVSATPPDHVCIAETDHYKNSGYPQHFFIWLGNGEIMDPLLSHGPTVNNYNIVSYRLFKGDIMDKKEIAEAICIVRRGSLDEGEVRFIEGWMGNGKDLRDYAYMAVLDGPLDDIYFAVHGQGNPQSEKDHYNIAFRKNEITLREYATMKYKNDVKPVLDAFDEQEETIASLRSEYKKGIERVEKDYKNQISTLKENCEKRVNNLAEKNKDLEDKLSENVKVEKVVIESLIWNFIKSIIKRGEDGQDKRDA